MSYTDLFQNLWRGNWLQSIVSTLRFGEQNTIVRVPFPSVDSAGPSLFGAQYSNLVSRPCQSIGSKRSASPEPETGSHKKKKLSRAMSGNTEEWPNKWNGVCTVTGESINPEGVTQGRCPSHFPPTSQDHQSKGFANLGNSCYRSSLLQALLHVPAIYHLLGTIHRDCDRPLSQCVVCAFQDLAQRYWSSHGGPMQYSQLDTAIRRNVPTGTGRGATEHSLASLHTDSQDDPMPLFEELLKQLRQADAPSVNEVFCMNLDRVWTCVICGKKHDSSADPSVVPTPHDYLTVPIHVPAEGFTLAEYLQSNVFTDANIKPRCESVECEATRTLYGDDSPDSRPAVDQCHYITKAPRVLVVQMKRFIQPVDREGRNMFDGNGRVVVRKYGVTVAYEEYLNLGRYTSDRQDLLYRLDATIAHRGGTVRSGHYVAAVRARNGHDFLTINDSNIEHDSNVSRLEYPTSRDDDFDSYILVYSLSQPSSSLYPRD